MASIQERRNKDGTITSFTIKVHRGRDSSGKQLKPYIMSYKPPATWNEDRAKKEAHKQAVLFEKQCKDGMAPDTRQTFAQYAEYVLKLKDRTGTKYRTIERYRGLLERVNEGIGHIKLADLRPQHLNELYENLGEKGIRKDGKYLCKADLRQILKDSNQTKVAFSQKAGVSLQVIDSINKGRKVSKSSAELISVALGKPLKSIFTPVKSGERLSTKTILEHHRLVSTILTQAEKEMLIPYNPARKATPPKQQRPTVNYYQIDTLEKIITCLESEPLLWQTLIHLMMITGCRRGEILGLKWKAIDFNSAQIKIENNLLYSPTKGIYESTPKTGETRLVKVPPETIAILKEYRLHYKKQRLLNGDRWQFESKWQGSDFVFVNDKGIPLNPCSVTTWLSRFSKRHNLPHVNAHAFRHSYASVLISQGVDIVTVSRQLGHAKTSTTVDFYGQLMEQSSERAADSIANAILRKAK